MDIRRIGIVSTAAAMFFTAVTAAGRESLPVPTGVYRIERPGEKPLPVVGGIIFAPDGKTAAVPYGRAAVMLYNTESGRRITKTGNLKNNGTAQMAFSPDGRIFIADDGEKGLCAWDAATGRQVWRQPVDMGRFATAAFSPKGDMLAVTAADGTLYAWDTAAWRLRLKARREEGSFMPCVFSPDGKLLAVPGNETLRFYSVPGGEHRFKVEPVLQAAFAPDGKTVLVEKTSGDMALIATGNGNRLIRRSIADAGISSAGFSPDGTLLIMKDAQEGMTAWDAATGRKKCRFREAHGELPFKTAHLLSVRPAWWKDGNSAFACDMKHPVAAVPSLAR